MQFSTTSLLAIMASVVAATEQLQLNYYSDDGCSEYLGQVDVTWATSLYGSAENCYNYNYGTSVNIADCYEGSCLCNFYYEDDCGGGAVQQTYGGCITNSAQLYSFACYYY